MNEITPLTDRNSVSISNLLLNSKWSLGEAEFNIIFKMITEIQMEDEDFKTYSIKVIELEEKLGIDLRREQLNKYGKRLQSNPFVIKEEDGDLIANWCSDFKYIPKKGIINISFSPKIKPYLIQLKDKFTVIEAKEIFQISGMYSKKLYTILIEHIDLEYYECKKQKKEPTLKYSFKIEDLQEILNIKKSMRIYGDFKRFVLEPMEKEINQNTHLSLKYECSKTGRKYTDITFTLKDNRKEKEYINYKDLKNFKEWFISVFSGWNNEILDYKGMPIFLKENGFFENKLEFTKFNTEMREEIWSLLYKDRSKFQEWAVRIKK